MNIKYIKTTDNKKYDLRDKRITDTDTGIATQSANGLLSSGDKKKLDGIASGAEVNQNAFSNIKIGNTTIAADGKTDTVELAAGNNITLTPDATNDKITIAATDTNTTYTFKGGTNQFTVTPSNGTTQTVSVTPSIANNVTGSDLTANTIILGNGNSGVKKSEKTIVTTLGSDDTTVPTSKAVWTAISNGIAAADAMIYRGTIAGGSTGAYGTLTPFANNGWTYKVTTAGKINGKAVEIGDMLICNKDGTTAATSSNYSTIAANWDVIQANIDGAVTGPASSTDAHVAVFNGATGKVIKDSGFTIAKSVPSNAVFTDTHYTTHLYAGSGTAANAATTNGNTKLTVVDNTTTRNSVTIKGTGGTTVTSDANGVVTIDSVNKNSKWFNFNAPGKVDDALYFIISPIGTSTATGSGTCYSIEINAVVQSSPGVYIVSNAKFVTWCYWYGDTAGIRITYPVYSNSRIPIYYHNKAEGIGIGNETGSSRICNIPIKVQNVESLPAVNIKVEGPGVSECVCSRSYSSFNWGQDEPTSWSST